jgi:hypothetical protein
MFLMGIPFSFLEFMMHSYGQVTPFPIDSSLISSIFSLKSKNSFKNFGSFGDSIFNSLNCED